MEKIGFWLPFSFFVTWFFFMHVKQVVQKNLTWSWVTLAYLFVLGEVQTPMAGALALCFALTLGDNMVMVCCPQHPD